MERTETNIAPTVGRAPVRGGIRTGAREMVRGGGGGRASAMFDSLPLAGPPRRAATAQNRNIDLAAPHYVTPPPPARSSINV